jgi:drug/metabolite transporter (DMT)-like permease
MPTFQFGRGERWALVSAFAYTAVNVTLRLAAPTIDPVLGSLLRQVPLAIIAWLFLVSTGAGPVRPRSPEFFGWPIIVALLAGGAASFVLGNILYFQALTNGGLGVTVGGVQAGSVLGGLWIGLLALRERPPREQLFGALVIVAGLVEIGIAQTGSVIELWWLGLLFALGAGTTYAFSNTLSRWVQRQRPLLFAALAVSSIGGLVPLLVMVIARGATGATIAADGPSVVAVLGAGLANAVALASLALAVRSAPVATVNTISSSSIVLSFIASVVLFNELGSPPMIVGITLVTAGIIVSQVRRRPPAPDATAAATPPEAGT